MAFQNYRDIAFKLTDSVEAHFVLSDASAFKKVGSFLPNEQSLRTLEQIHSAEGTWVDWDSGHHRGDWIATREKNLAVGVFVADCTAILVSGQMGGESFVAAIHAGWRGTASGIIQKFFEQTGLDLQSCRAWLSPNICKEHYEVSSEVIARFPEEKIGEFILPTRPGHFLLDLKSYQKTLLHEFGLSFESLDRCTFSDQELFSYRASGQKLEARHLAWVKI